MQQATEHDIETVSYHPLTLTKNDSNVLKGIALVMLLIHHLFYIQNGRFDDIVIYRNAGLTNIIGQFCKVCVPLFIFLSGYGLAASHQRFPVIDMKSFYIHRFTKLYINYWLIWLLFVPIGFLFFDLSLSEVYNERIPLKLALDFLGLLNLTGEYGINPTWWFYSCITILYLVFPVIFKWLRQHYKTAKILWWGSLGFAFLPFTVIQPFRFYLFTFITGIYFQTGHIYKIFPPLNNIIERIVSGNSRFRETIIIFILLILYIPARVKLPYGLLCDSFATILIILLYKNIRMASPVSNFLTFTGTHSFNIFLFHTFLFFLYLPDIIYWHRNPILCFLTLLAMCLPISIIIEKLKSAIRLNKFTNQIETFLYGITSVKDIIGKRSTD